MKSRKKKRKVFCCCRRKVASSDDEGNLNSELLLCQQLCKSFRSVKAGEGMFVDVARSRVYTKLSALVHDYYLCNSKMPKYWEGRLHWVTSRVTFMQYCWLWTREIWMGLCNPIWEGDNAMVESKNAMISFRQYGDSDWGWICATISDHLNFWRNSQ